MLLYFPCVYFTFAATSTIRTLLHTASDMSDTSDTSADEEVPVDIDRKSSHSPSPDSGPSLKYSQTEAEEGNLVFGDVQRLAKLVCSTTKILPCIPAGRKDNVLFVTRLCLDEHRGRATYADDCGVWKSKSSTTTCIHYVTRDGRLVYVRRIDGNYCTGGRNGIWRPLTPQPQPTDVVKAHRHYATLQADENYRKRVTWFSNLPGGDQKAVVEYQGIHPGTSLPHGNAKRLFRPYVRAHPETVQRVDKKVKHRQ